MCKQRTSGVSATSGVLRKMLVVGLCVAAGSALAAAPADQVATAPPPLQILLPQAGAVVGARVAVVLQTPADIATVTMDAPKVSTHLHLALGDTTVMPVRSDLIALGGDRYVYLFDLPVGSGSYVLQAYWSDASHQTLPETIQSLSIEVCAEDK